MSCISSEYKITFNEVLGKVPDQVLLELVNSWRICGEGASQPQPKVGFQKVEAKPEKPGTIKPVTKHWKDIDELRNFLYGKKAPRRQLKSKSVTVGWVAPVDIFGKPITPIVEEEDIPNSYYVTPNANFK
jgi:hypothetical protein